MIIAGPKDIRDLRSARLVTSSTSATSPPSTKPVSRPITALNQSSHPSIPPRTPASLTSPRPSPSAPGDSSASARKPATAPPAHAAAVSRDVQSPVMAEQTVSKAAATGYAGKTSASGRRRTSSQGQGPDQSKHIRAGSHRWPLAVQNSGNKHAQSGQQG